jgi:hypothetical protein
MFFSKFFYYNVLKRLKFAVVVTDYVILCFAIPAFCCVIFLCLKI